MSSTPLFNTEGGFEGAATSLETGTAWLAQCYALQAAMYGSSQMELVSWLAWDTNDGQLETGNNDLTEVGVACDQVSNWRVGYHSTRSLFEQWHNLDLRPDWRERLSSRDYPGFFADLHPGDLRLFQPVGGRYSLHPVSRSGWRSSHSDNESNTPGRSEAHSARELVADFIVRAQRRSRPRCWTATRRTAVI
jgi:hypothetical protein